MPIQVVDVDLSTETGAIPRPTFSDLLVVAREPTTQDPTYNEPLIFDSASQVATEFGTDSDAHEAALEISSQGARHWWTVMLETESHNETLGDSDTESTDEGTVENTPIRGGEDNIDISVDGIDQTLVFTTKSPPDKPSPTETAINTDTGEVVTGESTDGESAGIVVEYETTSFEDAEAELSSGHFDLTILADTRADESYIGELDELLTWATGNDAGLIVAYANGNSYDSEEDAMQAAHRTGAYLTSGAVLPIAHKSNDDVAAGIAGRLSTKRPWHNVYMDGGADFNFSMENYRDSVVGSPGQTNTFEGGDSSGGGPTNVLHRRGGVQILTNSLSTAGSDSNYQFFDVRRTENFIVHEVVSSLDELRLSREHIPFAPIGRSLIEKKLRDRLNQYVSPTGRALTPEEMRRIAEGQDDGESAFFMMETDRAMDVRSNVPLSQAEVFVPRHDDLSQAERANRVWSGIRVDVTLAGNVHTFSVDLMVTV